MSAVFSDALRVQMHVFELQKEERRGHFVEHVLEPMRAALMPPPGMGDGSADLWQISRNYKLLDPDADPELYRAQFALLAQANIIERCCGILRRAHDALQPEAHGIDATIYGHVVIADPLQAEHLAVDDGYTGYGGHSGHGIVHVDPNEKNVDRIPAALAHEYHHNVRLRYEPWTRETTVGQYAILEGLAEAFAVELCGEAFAGPWVTRQTPEEREHARKVIAPAMNVSGWNEIRSYIFGDWVAEQCGQPQRGLVRSAGYAVGYDCVRAYCKQTGRSVAEATYVPWREIAEFM
jgi:uncharacterized protein YjaZ